MCDNNWTITKWFITLNEHNVVAVWELDSQKIIRGHKAHVGEIHKRCDYSSSEDAYGGVMCMTKSRYILSIDIHAFVKYCVTSNTYCLLPENFITKRNAISIIKASPYEEDVVAVGYKSGLVLITDTKSIFPNCL